MRNQKRKSDCFKKIKYFLFGGDPDYEYWNEDIYSMGLIPTIILMLLGILPLIIFMRFVK